MKRIEVISDGTANGTQVLVDGERLHNVTGVSWEVNTDSGFARLSLRTITPDMVATSTILGSEDLAIPFRLSEKKE